MLKLYCKLIKMEDFLNEKILLTLLAVLMFATTTTANVLANNSSKFDSYITFGDSFTRGMGANQEQILGAENDATNMEIRIVDDAYTTQIADYYDLIPEKGDSEDKAEQYEGQIYQLSLTWGNFRIPDHYFFFLVMYQHDCLH